MLSPSTENSHDLRSHRNTQFIYQSFKNTINTRGMWGNQNTEHVLLVTWNCLGREIKANRNKPIPSHPLALGEKRKWTEPSTLPSVAWTAFLFLEWFVVCHIAGESLQGSWEPHCRQWWQSALAIYFILYNKN